MSSIFRQHFCLLPDDAVDGRIPLFNSKEDLDIFQYRMGLDCLCQNTLVYPKYREGTGIYEKTQSSNAEEFYFNECRKCCGEGLGRQERDIILDKIAGFFCEGKSDYLRQGNITIYKKNLYDESCSEQYFIRYRCPLNLNRNLLKFAFPIYVEGEAVAVLCTGQFFVGEPSQYNGTQKWHHYFSNDEELSEYINKAILPIIRDFRDRAQENLFFRRSGMLEKVMKECLTDMEEDMTEFLLHMPEELQGGESADSLKKTFWETAQRHLDAYIREIGVEELIVFISQESVQNDTPQKITGIQLAKDLREVQALTFDLSRIISEQKKQGERKLLEFTRYDTSIKEVSGVQRNQPEKKDILMPLFNLTTLFPGKKWDVLVHLEKIQPFALAVRYSQNSFIEKYSFTERKKYLNQLNTYFEKVGQEFAYFGIRVSDHASKTVLRIYRHEITHQVAILQRNNRFLNTNRLRRIDDLKLKMIAEDQMQCLRELDFMTQNIDIMTGRIRDRIGIEFLGDSPQFNIRQKLFNKIISLYSRKAFDKHMWINFQFNSEDEYLRSRLELLDLIFFNLMNNAIKYGHRGTNIFIRCEHNDSILPAFIGFRKYTISFTDYGEDVGIISPENPDIIFQMYFRATSNKQIEGSGIGLYAAKTIAGFLHADIKWRRTKVSDYNIPMLARFHILNQEGESFPGIDVVAAEAEYDKLEKEGWISRVCNEEYLKGSPKTSWIRAEIKGELYNPTYEVSFYVQVGDL